MNQKLCCHCASKEIAKEFEAFAFLNGSYMVLKSRHKKGFESWFKKLFVDTGNPWKIGMPCWKAGTVHNDNYAPMKLFSTDYFYDWTEEPPDDCPYLLEHVLGNEAHV
jgi:hypothetical protein